MDILAKIKELGHSFSGKHDGQSIHAVRIVDVGINAAKQLDWIKTAFTETDGGAEQVLMATQPVTDVPGKRGGNDHITLDGKAVGPYPADHEDFVAGIQVNIWQAKASLTIAYKYVGDDGRNHRFEFSARLPIDVVLPF